MTTTRFPMALVMIVRNEARCLERCLSSVAPQVDEMVVLDTGSTDGSVEIARRLGARVAHFTWMDDFSAARNHALSLAHAPWRLVLDADEWIVDGAECLAALRSLPDDFIGVVSVVSQVMGAAGEMHHAPSWLPRILPRSARYEGRIHEQPVAAVARRRLALQVAHDGYLPEQVAGKRGRNRRLLMAALVEHPGDAYLSYQLGKDFEVAGEFASALPCYDMAYEKGEVVASWRHDLVLRLLFTLKKMRSFDEALVIAAREQARWAHSPDFFFTLGDLLLDAALARPDRAAEWLPRIEAAWLRAIAIGEQPDLPDSLSGRGSHLAAHNLAAFHASLGNQTEADAWREKARRWRSAVAD